MGEKSHKQHNLIILTSSQFQNNYNCPLSRASDILRKKKQNFTGFSWANSRKNWPISWDFCGKKDKIRGKIGRFRGEKVKIHGKIGRFSGISWEKSQNSQKNRPILWDFSEKSQISKDFQGQILRKIS